MQEAALFVLLIILVSHLNGFMEIFKTYKVIKAITRQLEGSLGEPRQRLGKQSRVCRNGKKTNLQSAFS